VTADAAATRDVYTDAGELRGVWTRGAEPKELVLSDGSRLTLTDGERGQVCWRLHDAREGERAVSYEEALELAGDEFSDYVRVRTRAEAGWLRSVADWCGGEAERLERESDGRVRAHA
jgi:hypothetical protein